MSRRFVVTGSPRCDPMRPSLQPGSMPNGGRHVLSHPPHPGRRVGDPLHHRLPGGADDGSGDVVVLDVGPVSIIGWPDLTSPASEARSRWRNPPWRVVGPSGLTGSRRRAMTARSRPGTRPRRSPSSGRSAFNAFEELTDARCLPVVSTDRAGHGDVAGPAATPIGASEPSIPSRTAVI